MLSKIVRRTHMYLALFLTPWVLMYTLSTALMNHREHVHPQATFEKESEGSYAGIFPEGATPQQKAVQILRDLGLDGAHVVAKPAPDGTLTIDRMDPVAPKRIVFNESQGAVRIEKAAFTVPAFLGRMHRRRGYQQDYAADDAWAFSVDLFIAAMIFWAASGLWMWWEMRVTRRMGALFAGAGAVLFAAFLASI